MDSRNNEMWQELIETKGFDQLSDSELAFVLAQSTEEVFRLERTVLLESKIVYEEPEPHPLILKEEQKGIVIPLYQTILAVAASFLLAFFLFRSNGDTIKNDNNQVLATADTVYVEKRIFDTVIQTKTEYVNRYSNKSKTIKNEVQPTQNEMSPNSILSNQGSFEADLSSATLANKGTSAANDETLRLMEELVGPN